MKRLVGLSAVCMLITMTGCSPMSRQTDVPVEERSVEGGDIQDRAEQPAVDAPKGTATREETRYTDTQHRSSSSTGNPAVIAMLDKADRQRRAGNHDAAASSLERALNMDPKNAYLWHRLAALRLEQKNWQQAYVMANKSNSLIRDDPALSIRNWKIIAAAKRRQGDPVAAQEAEAMIRRLENQ